MSAVLGWLLVHVCAGADVVLEVANIASSVQMRRCTVLLGCGLAVEGSARILTSVRQPHCIVAVLDLILLAFGDFAVGCIFHICTCGVSRVAGLTVRGRGRQCCLRYVVVYRRDFFSGIAGSLVVFLFVAVAAQVDREWKSITILPERGFAMFEAEAEVEVVEVILLLFTVECLSQVAAAQLPIAVTFHGYGICVDEFVERDACHAAHRLDNSLAADTF